MYGYIVREGRLCVGFWHQGTFFTTAMLGEGKPSQIAFWEVTAEKSQVKRFRNKQRTYLGRTYGGEFIETRWGRAPRELLEFFFIPRDGTFWLPSENRDGRTIEGVDIIKCSNCGEFHWKTNSYSVDNNFYCSICSNKKEVCSNCGEEFRIWETHVCAPINSDFDLKELKEIARKNTGHRMVKKISLGEIKREETSLAISVAMQFFYRSKSKGEIPSINMEEKISILGDSGADISKIVEYLRAVSEAYENKYSKYHKRRCGEGNEIILYREHEGRSMSMRIKRTKVRQYLIDFLSKKEEKDVTLKNVIKELGELKAETSITFEISNSIGAKLRYLDIVNRIAGSCQNQENCSNYSKGYWQIFHSNTFVVVNIKNKKGNFCGRMLGLIFRDEEGKKYILFHRLYSSDSSVSLKRMKSIVKVCNDAGYEVITSTANRHSESFNIDSGIKPIEVHKMIMTQPYISIDYEYYKDTYIASAAQRVGGYSNTRDLLDRFYLYKI